MLEIITSFLFLFFLGCLGWAIFAFLRSPMPALLGSMTLIGALKIAGYSLPVSPSFLPPFVQVVLGLYVGSKLTKDTVRELKTMVLPALIIVFWALSVVFAIGYFLSQVTYLDPATAILSSSIGGLPEMTIIALAIEADIVVIIIMQSIRMIATAVAFPFIVNLWVKKEKNNSALTSKELAREEVAEINSRCAVFSFSLLKNFWLFLKKKPDVSNLSSISNVGSFFPSAWRGIFSLAIATTGGVLFLKLGVPAGGMVGAMFFTAIVSLLGVPVVTPSPTAFSFMLVGVGMMVSDNLSPATLATLLSGDILAPVIISNALIFMSSLLVAFLIHKVVGWDFPTSFLAAAPGGFTVMTALAIKYRKNPFRVSMLHLCRLLAIKSVVPFVFMLYI